MITKQELISKKEYNFDDLLAVMHMLRAPDGCAWDRVQTHQSIRKNLIEETYELVEAIDTSDFVLMREELGDVLMQVVFHCEISQENGEFHINDVINELVSKLIVRHPHVFSTEIADTPEAVLDKWDSVKRQTKHQTTDTEAMLSVSRALPSLMRAHKLGSKGRKVGFDFDNAEEALGKVYEELDEVSEAIRGGNREDINEEFGDLLLSVVNAARLAGVDSEQALYEANDKFIRRFAKVEEMCLSAGKSVSDTPREEKENFWLMAKEK